jgi:hypothetical protein
MDTESKKNSLPEPVIRFIDEKKGKPLAELRASDAPRGMDSDDLIDDETA